MSKQLVDTSLWKKITHFLLSTATKLPVIGGMINHILKDKDATAVVKGTVTTTVFKFLWLPLNFLTSLLVAQRYGAKAVWIYWLILAISWFIVLLAQWWLDHAMARLVETHKSNKWWLLQSLFSFSLVVSLWLGVLLFFLSELIAVWIFNDISLQFPIKVLAFFIPFISLWKLWLAYLLANRDTVEAEMISKVLIPIVLLSVVIWGFFIRKTYYIPVWWYLISWLVWTLCIGFVLLKWSNNKKWFQPVSLKPLLSVSSPLMFAAVSWFIVMNCDTLMVGALMDVESAGIYSVLFSLSGILLLPLWLLMPVIVPELTTLYRRKETKRFKSLLSRMTEWVLLLGTVLFIVLLLLSKWILSLYWPEFIKGLTALYVIATWYYITLYFAFNWAIAANCWFEKETVWISLLAAILNIWLNRFLIPLWWILWAWIASSIAFTMSNTLLSSVLYKKGDIKTRVSLFSLCREIYKKGSLL